MKALTRTAALLLSALMLAALFGCAKPDTPVDDTTAAAQTSAETVPETDEKDLIDPKLPALNWEGEEFHVMYNGNDLEPNLDFVAEDLDGSVLNDAVYNRNLYINNKHNLRITWTHGKDNDIITAVENNFAGGVDFAQLVEVDQNHSMTMAIKGHLVELAELTNIDTSKPYWYSDQLEGSSLANKNFFAYSDSCVHAFGATPVTIFNKTVHEDQKLDNIYQIVRDGNWTHEVMGRMVKQVTADIDGDGKITKDDRLGMIANTFSIDCFISGSGYHMMLKDADDMPVLNIENEAFYNIIESIKTLCAEENGMMLVDRISTTTEAREHWTVNALTDDRALFLIGNFKDVALIRSTECDFGVVPIPKVNKDQEEYKIHMQANVGAAMSVPKSAEARAADISLILEDIAWQSYLNVMPAYMDVLIQGQSIRDSESLECIQLIRNSYYCDIGFMLGNYGVSILNEMRKVVKDNTSVNTAVKTQSRAFQSAYAKIKSEFKP